MINIYHCKKCHYEWESIKYEFKCPRCDAEIDVMVEMTLGFYNQLLENFEELEKKHRGKEKRYIIDSPKYRTGCTLGVTDRRKEIEQYYGSNDEEIRHLIEKFFKKIVVKNEDNKPLTVRISSDGKIEIIDRISGEVVPWSKLSDDEQWILWNNFNDLIDKLDNIQRTK